MNEPQLKLGSYVLEANKYRGQKIGPIFDRNGFVVNLENDGIFSKAIDLSLGDKLVAISSEKRKYFCKIFCLSLNNQKWASHIEGRIKLEMIKVTNNNKRKFCETDSDSNKKTKY